MLITGTSNAGFRVNDTNRDAPHCFVSLKDAEGHVVKVGVSVLSLDTFVLALPDGKKCVASAKLKARERKEKKKENVSFVVDRRKTTE
jgi:hypothetical protein